MSVSHYGASYFEWQRNVGAFGGWANLTKFESNIRPDHDVLDFGCGGGYLLKNLKCRRKIGVEVNPDARRVAAENGVEVFDDVATVDDESVDVIISNHALEHVPHPLHALTALRGKLRSNGVAVFVVPCEAISMSYRPNDRDHHLYTWSPMCLGNLFTDAGFTVIESRPYMHTWPPRAQTIARLGGRFAFDSAAKVWARLSRGIRQVRLVAHR